ncbi:hypothetical protein ACFXTH_035821 [Malus domestica]
MGRSRDGGSGVRFVAVVVVRSLIWNRTEMFHSCNRDRRSKSVLSSTHTYRPSLLNEKSADQQLRSAKPTTIHDCTQSSNPIGLQKMLRENPSRRYCTNSSSCSCWLQEG